MSTLYSYLVRVVATTIVLTWALVRPQSHTKTRWRRLRCVSSGLTLIRRIGFWQSGQTGGRIGAGGLGGWCTVRPLRQRE